MIRKPKIPEGQLRFQEANVQGLRKWTRSWGPTVRRISLCWESLGSSCHRLRPGHRRPLAPASGTVVDCSRGHQGLSSPHPSGQSSLCPTPYTASSQHTPLHLQTSSQASKATIEKEISSLHPGTASFNEEAAAISFVTSSNSCVALQQVEPFHCSQCQGSGERGGKTTPEHQALLHGGPRSGLHQDLKELPHFSSKSSAVPNSPACPSLRMLFFASFSYFRIRRLQLSSE